MSGINKPTLLKRLTTITSKGIEFFEPKMAEILTPGGVQGVELLPESLVSKWVVKDNPELAEKMLQAGCRVYLHKLAGLNKLQPV